MVTAEIVDRTRHSVAMNAMAHDTGKTRLLLNTLLVDIRTPPLVHLEICKKREAY